MPKEKVIIDEARLRDLYLVQRLSLWNISVIFDCAHRTVTNKLKRFDIPVREPLTLRGRRLSVERRKQISEAAFRRYAKSTPDYTPITPQNKRIRFSLEYALWREAVFKRDDWTCQHCGKRGGDIQADHIKPFSTHPELRFELSNGQTLCLKCHKKRTAEQHRNGELKRNRVTALEADSK